MSNLFSIFAAAVLMLSLGLAAVPASAAGTNQYNGTTYSAEAGAGGR